MSDFPSLGLEPCVTIHPYSLIESIGEIITGTNNAGVNGVVSVTYPIANLALFFPFFVAKSITVLNLFWINGATANGNVDVGIYTADGTKLVSTGSTPQVGVNVDQEVAISLELGPGLFYLAVAMDNIVGTLAMGNVSNIEIVKGAGAAEMANAFPLPATAVLATSSQFLIALIGLSTRSFI